MPFYYAITDEHGVLCVDQLDTGQRDFTAERVADIAKQYPDSIYFEYPTE